MMEDIFDMIFGYDIWAWRYTYLGWSGMCPYLIVLAQVVENVTEYSWRCVTYFIVFSHFAKMKNSTVYNLFRIGNIF